MAYFGRPDEVHVNLALGRLCTIGCRECSATLLGRRLDKPLRGSLRPEAIGRKVEAIAEYLALRLHRRKLSSAP